MQNANSKPRNMSFRCFEIQRYQVRTSMAMSRTSPVNPPTPIIVTTSTVPSPLAGVASKLLAPPDREVHLRIHLLQLETSKRLNGGRTRNCKARNSAIEGLDPRSLPSFCKTKTANISSSSSQIRISNGTHPPIIFKHSSATYLHTIPASTFSNAVVPPSSLAPSASLRCSNS